MILHQHSPQKNSLHHTIIILLTRNVGQEAQISYVRWATGSWYHSSVSGASGDHGEKLLGVAAVDECASNRAQEPRTSRNWGRYNYFNLEKSSNFNTVH